MALPLRRPARPARARRPTRSARRGAVVAVALPVGPARRAGMERGQPGRGYDPAGPGSAGAVVQARVRHADPVLQGPGGGGDDERGRRARRRRVVVDSSGNAGIAVAAYAARAGMAAEVFVPAGDVAGQGGGHRGVRGPGGRRRRRPGRGGRGRPDAAEETGAWYASHVYRPAFVHGVKTLAFELWEQLGGRAPGTVVVPAGNGTLVLGLWLGFRELAAAVASTGCRRSSPCRPSAAPRWPAGPQRSDGGVGHRHRGAAPRERSGLPSWRPAAGGHRPRGGPRPRPRRAGPPGLRRRADRSGGLGRPAGPRGRTRSHRGGARTGRAG